MIYCVLGLGYGDEGKGLVVDYLCAHAQIDMVARFSGGHQAGHTVCYNNKRHVFSNIGSGALRQVPTYWAAQCVFDPVGLMKEIIHLGQDVNITIHPACPVVTPYEKSIKLEGYMSCGVGHNETRQRQQTFSFCAADITNKWVTSQKLRALVDFYRDRRATSSLYLQEFQEACAWLSKYKGFRVGSFPDTTAISPNILFEGSQGLLLDKIIGVYPYVTNSDLIPPKGIDSCWLVTRAYATRHGDGPLAYEQNIHLREGTTDNETNTTNPYQGPLRYGLLDADLLKYAVTAGQVNGEKNLVVTCMDQMPEYTCVVDERIVHYRHQTDFLHFLRDHIGAHSVYGSFGPTANDIIKF